MAEAKANGKDTARAFINEYNGYKDQLIRPYLIETKAQQKLVEEAYERLKQEIDASHILILVAQDAPAEDTLAAYQKIAEIRQKALAGEAFNHLASTYSEDPSAKSNQGRLGYFTAFQMLYSFEEAAYQTPVDSVSGILRTKHGYHILKVNDKRPSSGQVKVSHIMLRSAGGDHSGNDDKKKIIHEIHDQLQQGTDWNMLCQQYSEDLRTKDAGGTLPFIGLKQINDPAFEAAAFALENPGDISEPVQSGFGWHILKLEEKKGLASFDALKPELEQQVSKDERSRLNKKAVINRLKASNGYQENSLLKATIIQMADSSLLTGNWKRPNNSIDEAAVLFSIHNQETSIGEMMAAIAQRQRTRYGMSPEDYMAELIEEIVEEKLLESEEKQLIANDLDFKMLLNEYYEGILLFDIMNEHVWNKASSDSLGQRQYFKENADNYQWGQRAEAVIVTTDDPQILTNIKKSMHDESIKLMEIALGLEGNEALANNQDLAALVKLFQKYESSQIEIHASEAMKATGLYHHLLQYLEDVGMDEYISMKEGEPGNEDKILVQLNSDSKKSLEYLYNKESALTLQVTEGLFEKGERPEMDAVEPWEEGLFEYAKNGIHYLVGIVEIHEPQAKSFEDTRGKVISDYQEYLEKKWLSELKNKYAIVINYTTLDKIKKVYSKKLAASR
ncbi:MAG: peptidylprolyl isomerase [Cyclobacteriaceae bacterium]|nr:peptidylprolyl isomerase [Cyclobacteriaceae bacterium]